MVYRSLDHRIKKTASDFDLFLYNIWEKYEKAHVTVHLMSSYCLYKNEKKSCTLIDNSYEPISTQEF